MALAGSEPIHWLTLQLLPARQRILPHCVPYIPRTVDMCCKWSAAVIPSIPSESKRCMDNMTCTGSSLPVVLSIAIKCSVPPVYPSRPTTNLLGSLALVFSFITFDSAIILCFRYVLTDTGFNWAILQTYGQSMNPNGKFYITMSSIH